ncbi:heparan-alpha-glucosaminide N-acetyltransferase domain-containing protein [Sorangium sp. So ce260]|uniref:acyltransferase family protein n=1 Tax=Sorangium sp. So ce260 TaxID=3133291 RepID=UPI003F621131
MRLQSLDIFRGMTIVAMILVNFQGDFPAIYPPLAHSTWEGCTLADTVFPCFLFIIGVTLHISMSGRRARGATDGELARQIVRRGAIFILLGLFLSAFPFFPEERLTALRIPGVLQRIGAAYVLAALLCLKTTARQQAGIIAATLIGYWLLLRLYPLDDPHQTLAARVDRYFLEGHIARKGWDAMGILPTVPAAMTVVLGSLGGRWLTANAGLRARIAGLLAAGAAGIALGFVWRQWFPWNRGLYSSSFALFTAGVAAVVLAACMWIVDVKRWRRWGAPFLIFGANPIAAYVGSTMMTHLLYYVNTTGDDGATTSLNTLVYTRLFAQWLSPLNASLAFALAAVALWLVLLYPLHRRGIFLKV